MRAKARLKTVVPFITNLPEKKGFFMSQDTYDTLNLKIENLARRLEEHQEMEREERGKLVKGQEKLMEKLDTLSDYMISQKTATKVVLKATSWLVALATTLLAIFWDDLKNKG